MYVKIHFLDLLFKKIFLNKLGKDYHFTKENHTTGKNYCLIILKYYLQIIRIHLHAYSTNSFWIPITCQAQDTTINGVQCFLSSRAPGYQRRNTYGQIMVSITDALIEAGM